MDIVSGGAAKRDRLLYRVLLGRKTFDNPRILSLMTAPPYFTAELSYAEWRLVCYALMMTANQESTTAAPEPVNDTERGARLAKERFRDLVALQRRFLR